MLKLEACASLRHVASLDQSVVEADAATFFSRSTETTSAAWVNRAIFRKFGANGESFLISIVIGFVHASELKTRHAALWVLFVAVCVGLACLEHACPPVRVADFDTIVAVVTVVALAARSRSAVFCGFHACAVWL